FGCRLGASSVVRCAGSATMDDAAAPMVPTGLSRAWSVRGRHAVRGGHGDRAWPMTVPVGDPAGERQDLPTASPVRNVGAAGRGPGNDSAPVTDGDRAAAIRDVG